MNESRIKIFNIFFPIPIYALISWKILIKINFFINELLFILLICCLVKANNNINDKIKGKIELHEN